MSNHLDGKVITITGAASGMGRATALLLASRGAKVSLCDIQEKELEAVVEEIKQSGASVFGAVVDVRDRAAVESWVHQTVETFGKIDGVANIAGSTGKDLGRADLVDIDDEDWEFVFDVNVKGLIHCLRAQVPNMNDGGSIVNVSSLSSVLGFPRHYAYNASKHAVNGITKCAAKELAHRKIRVNIVAPYVRSILYSWTIFKIDCDTQWNHRYTHDPSGRSYQRRVLDGVGAHEKERYCSGDC